jgi:hypothetical protein
MEDDEATFHCSIAMIGGFILVLLGMSITPVNMVGGVLVNLIGLLGIAVGIILFLITRIGRWWYHE